MTVKALMPVRNMDLVAPLAHKATDRHTTDTAATCPPLRACALCVHGQDRGGERVCASPAVTAGGVFLPQPVVVARRSGQACGPDAAHLHIAAWGPLP